MTQKHYQNDYKKLLGVDESRTASEKLLDRDLCKRNENNKNKNISESIPKIVEQQPEKKIKT